MPHAIGTVHGRSVRAPQTIRTIAIGKRTQAGIGTTGTGLGVETLASMNRTQSPHDPGSMTKLTPAIAPVTPSAMPRLRQSRRATNHRIPMPGPIFVRSGIAHIAG